MKLKTILLAAALLSGMTGAMAQKKVLNCPNLNGETITVDLSAKPTASYLYKSEYDANYVDFRQYYVSYDLAKDQVTIKSVNTNAKKDVVLYKEIVFEKALLDFDRTEYEPSESYCVLGLQMKNYNKAITEFTCNLETGKQSSSKDSYEPFYFKTKAEAEAFVNHIKNLK